MKAKNVFLAIVALVFAIGSAIASTFVEDQIYVSAKRTEVSDPTCVCINKTCVQTMNTSKICRVHIAITKPGVGAQTACSNCTFKTYIDNACTIILYDAFEREQTGEPCNGTIYELFTPED